jgi:hypothetical protein
MMNPITDSSRALWPTKKAAFPGPMGDMHPVFVIGAMAYVIGIVFFKGQVESLNQKTEVRPTENQVDAEMTKWPARDLKNDKRDIDSFGKQLDWCNIGIQPDL